jgi:hypothetical protein
LRDTASARDHKYAVLHIFAGVLLLLKERLRKAHPSLIFKRVEDVAKEFSKDDVKTVTFDEAVERLRSCANVDIPANQLATLRTAQRIRNQIEHYEVSLNLKQTQAVVGRLCEFAYFFFMRDHLNESLGQHLKGDVWHCVVELRGIANKLEEERLEDWRERASKYAKIGTQQSPGIVSAAPSLWAERSLWMLALTWGQTRTPHLHLSSGSLAGSPS